MINEYVLDACALTAFLYDEPGADHIESILEEANSGRITLYMHKINVLEVYYNIYRAENKEQAHLFYIRMNELPIQIIHEVSDKLFFEAGRLKATYKMSLADSIAVAEALTRNAALMTSDHHEFDIIEGKENIKFDWIR